MEAEPLLGRRKPSHKGCALAASAVAILGTLAVLAIMGSPDGESASWSVEEGSIKESMQLLHEHLSAADSDSNSAQLVTDVDNDDAWADLQAQAAGTLSDAQHQDEQTTAEAAEQQEKSSLDSTTAANADLEKHVQHHQIRERAAQDAQDIIAKDVDELEHGAAAASTKAAVQAAHAVIAKANAEKAIQQAKQDKALNQASEITSLMDRIKAAKAQLQEIQKRRKEARQKHMEESTAFAERVTSHAATAKEKFKKMHNLLESMREANATLATESEEYASVMQQSRALSDEVSELQAQVTANIRSNTKEVGEKDRESATFQRKEKQVTDKMTDLINKMKKAIKVTAIRKATPHPESEAELKDLNDQSQSNAVTIADLSVHVKSLKEQLDKSKDLEAELAEKKVHRTVLLKKAKETQASLTEAVERYKKAVERKDVSTSIVKQEPKGTTFTKKLFDKLDGVVSSSIDKGMADVQHQYTASMADHMEQIKDDSEALAQIEADV